MQWNRSNNHASVNCIGALLKNDHGRAIKYYSFFSMGSACNHILYDQLRNRLKRCFRTNMGHGRSG